MPEFIDLFSHHAALYAMARPHYPPELFEYLAGLCGTRKLVWDVGTGNGQAAVGLAAHFERVIATDASAEQIRHAAPHLRVSYHVAAAEDPALIAAPHDAERAPAAHAACGEDLHDSDGLIPPAGVDLVTIAQALHWLDHDAFYANVRRALRPGGVIAAWCYTLPRVDERVDAVLDAFYHGVIGPYWEPRRRYIDERFETIPFPFTEMHPSCDRLPLTMRSMVKGEGAGSLFACRSEWNLAEYLAYIESWSAVQKYRRERGSDPLDLICDNLSRAWGDADSRRTAWSPIHLRVGRSG